MGCKRRTLKTAYQNTNPSLRAGVWFAVCNFLQKGIAMLSLPIFTRLLSMEEYGQLTIYQSWHTLLALFVTLNLSGSVINNGMVKYEQDRDGFLSSVQLLATAVTAVFLAVYLLWADVWNRVFELTTPLMLIMFAQFLFEPAYQMWLQRNRFTFQYKRAVAVTLLVSLASPLLGVALVLAAQDKALARILAYALVQIAVGGVIYAVQLRKGKKLFAKEYWKFALVFNLPLIPHYSSQHILGQADRIMISRMVGSAEAAIYGVSGTVGTAISLLVNAINSSFVPTLYQNMKAGEYASIRRSSSLICGFMAAMTCVMMLLAPEMVLILAGREYAQAVYVIPPITASIFFTFVYTLFINIEFYFEQTRYTMYISVVCALLNLVLNYLLIPAFGYVAAGYTTLFCFLLFAVGHYLLSALLLKKHQVPEAVFDRKVIQRLGILVLICTVVMSLLYSLPVLRLGLLAGCCLAAFWKRKALAAFLGSILKR